MCVSVCMRTCLYVIFSISLFLNITQIQNSTFNAYKLKYVTMHLVVLLLAMLTLMCLHSLCLQYANFKQPEKESESTLVRTLSLFVCVQYLMCCSCCFCCSQQTRVYSVRFARFISGSCHLFHSLAFLLSLHPHKRMYDVADSFSTYCEYQRFSKCKQTYFRILPS